MDFQPRPLPSRSAHAYHGAHTVINLARIKKIYALVHQYVQKNESTMLESDTSILLSGLIATAL